ncbi:MAG: hypothetical protein ACYC5Y_03950 [Symbiobacteriia bacterium]
MPTPPYLGRPWTDLLTDPTLQENVSGLVVLTVGATADEASRPRIQNEVGGGLGLRVFILALLARLEPSGEALGNSVRASSAASEADRVTADGDVLRNRLVGGQIELAAQFGLPSQDQGNGGAAVHLGIGEEPHLDPSEELV